MVRRGHLGLRHLAKGTPAARFLASLGALLLLSGCFGAAPPITSCEPAAGLTPDCRFQNPEDLAPAPNGTEIIVSQYSDMAGTTAGSLVAWQPASGRIRPLFPGDADIAPIEGWGEIDCAAPDASQFAPHGIDTRTIVTGEQVLYVVNHGGRESIEMFELADRDGATRLTWRGCALAPEDGFFNDVAVLASGEFRVSQMYPRSANALLTLLRMQLSDYSPGFVYHWSPANGFEPLPGSEAKFANGVALSADDRFLYVNSYLGNEVIKVDTETGKRVASVAVQSPDNLTWSPTGELLAASHLASIADTLACGEVTTGNCGFAFRIVAIDTDAIGTDAMETGRMTVRTVLEHEGPPMGAATVALPFGDGLYLGTFAGDRIVRADAALLTPPDSEAQLPLANATGRR